MADDPGGGVERRQAAFVRVQVVFAQLAADGELVDRDALSDQVPDGGVAVLSRRSHGSRPSGCRVSIVSVTKSPSR